MMSLSELVVPHIGLPGGTLSGEEAFARAREGLRDGVLGSTERAWTRTADKFISWMAGFGDAVENKLLDHIFNDAAYSAPSPYLALGTAAINESDVAATFGGTTEANYTSYARVAIAGSDMNPASAGSKNNVNAITFPGCTGGTSTVIAWCVTSAGPARLAAGDVIVFGTCTSTVISTTQTPPSVAATNLVVNLD